MANYYKPLQYLALVTFLLITGNCKKVQGDGDAQFEDFLNTAIVNYTHWLQENKLDPSPRTSDGMSGFHGHIDLDCRLTNHYATGHSSGADSNIRWHSNFTGHTFELVRSLSGAHEFNGDFNCTGRMYPKMNISLDVSGHGNFSVAAHDSYEYLTLRNVGITQDYKLDFSHSWAVYRLDLQGETFQINGEWNEPKNISAYLVDVENAFAGRYKLATDPHSYRESAKFPTGQLLERYVGEVTDALDLKEIINEKDLPSPYVPTPIPTPPTTPAPEPSTDKNGVERRSVLPYLYYLMIVLANIFMLV